MNMKYLYKSEKLWSAGKSINKFQIYYKSYIKEIQKKQRNTCKSLYFLKTFSDFLCLTSKSTKSQYQRPTAAIVLVPLNNNLIWVQSKTETDNVD